jgi:predicted ArsR family transcriptional regulator
MIQETSLQARRFVERNLSERAYKVLSVIEQHGPLTLFEIGNILHVPDHTISGRITELRKANRLEKTELRRTNPMSGRGAIVWKLVTPPAPVVPPQPGQLFPDSKVANTNRIY